MTESEWAVIADRLEEAWQVPAMTPGRRGVYFDVLSDLEADAVREACGVLMREDRETVPPPGVIRSHALEQGSRGPRGEETRPPAPASGPARPEVIRASAPREHPLDGHGQSKAVVVVFWIWLSLFLLSVVAVFAKDSVLADDPDTARIGRTTVIEALATIAAWLVIFVLVFGTWELIKWMRRRGARGPNDDRGSAG